MLTVAFSTGALECAHRRWICPRNETQSKGVANAIANRVEMVARPFDVYVHLAAKLPVVSELANFRRRIALRGNHSRQILSVRALRLRAVATCRRPPMYWPKFSYQLNHKRKAGNYEHLRNQLAASFTCPNRDGDTRTRRRRDIRSRAATAKCGTSPGANDRACRTCGDSAQRARAWRGGSISA